jgi:glycosyltransferase involved in cell wall biosynthesis
MGVKFGEIAHSITQITTKSAGISFFNPFHLKADQDKFRREFQGGSRVMAGDSSTGLKPFRIGIFWESEGEAFPGRKGNEFLSSLVAILLRLEEPAELILFVSPQDLDATAALKYQSGGRLRSVSIPAHQSTHEGPEPFYRRLGKTLVATGELKEFTRKLRCKIRSRISNDIRSVLSSAQSKLQSSPFAGAALVFLGMCLASAIFLTYWCLYTVIQLTTACLRSVAFPWRFVLKINRFRRLADQLKLSLDPLILAKETECDVWLVPPIRFPQSLKNLKAATVLLIPDDLAEVSAEATREVTSKRVDEASLCVWISSVSMNQNPELPAWLDPTKTRQVSIETMAGVQDKSNSKNLIEAAQSWMRIFREAVEVAQWRSTFERRPLEIWPRLDSIPASPREPLKVFVFLPQVYFGGVLEVTRELTSELAAINKERRQLDLTLALHADQGHSKLLDRLGEVIKIVRMRLHPIHADEAIRLCGGKPSWLTNRPEHEYCFFNGAARAAMDADAWFSLVDRFPLPLLPARPLGILIHDVLQRKVPEVFNAAFFRSQARGIIPTARSAEANVAMTPQTRDDVIAEYELEPNRVRLIPVACNPHWHFSHLQSRAVRRIRKPFILNVTNSSIHKGPDVLLLAYAQLKRRMGDQTPQLAMCGFGTQGFSPNYKRDDDLPFWRSIRQLVVDLGLEEGRDVLFLGAVSDEQLRYLYEHCSVVVNAARYDNGCLCLAEGAYFGHPAVSSRYPAAEFHAARFGYRAGFFPVGDDKALAEALESALKEPPATPEDVQRARDRFLDPEFSYRRYGERYYDLLVQLAELGRRQYRSEQLRMSA